MYSKTLVTPASLKSAAITWQLNGKTEKIAVSLNPLAVVAKMVRNRAIDKRIRTIQVTKSVAVWNTANQSSSILSIQRISAERNAIQKMERMKL